jgi:lipopolysaccharide export system protein LptA
LNFHEKARLKRNLDEVSGDHITYSAKTEVFRVDSSEAGSGNVPPQRVRAVLQPKSKEAKTSPAAPDILPITPSKNLTPTE